MFSQHRHVGCFKSHRSIFYVISKEIHATYNEIVDRYNFNVFHNVLFSLSTISTLSVNYFVVCKKKNKLNDVCALSISCFCGT